MSQNMLTVIYDRTDKEYLYDAEENFVDTVHEWLDGQCTPEQLEQEPCEVKGIREEVLHGKGIQTGGSGRLARVAEPKFQYGAEAFEARQKEAEKALTKDNVTKNMPVKSGKSR